MRTMCAAAAGVTEGGADRGLLDSNLLISGAHQKATRAFGKVSDSNWLAPLSKKKKLPQLKIKLSLLKIIPKLGNCENWYVDSLKRWVK